MTIMDASGELAEGFRGVTFDAKGSLAAQAHESGQPVLSDAQIGSRIRPGLTLGPTMAIPFSSSGVPDGVLTVSRLPGNSPFTRSDLEMAADFAGQASVALQLAAGRSDRERLAVLEDRGRTARDLHDHVIQRLFGAGLSLQAVAGAVQEESVRARIIHQVDALDAAIADIRTAIFALSATSSTDAPTLRHRVVDVIGELADFLPQPPRVTFSGAVDLMVDRELADDVVAVVREGLTNIARHAEANESSVAVTVASGRLSIRIEDDGRGIRGSSRSSGTTNLRRRATHRRGTLTLSAGDPSGTVLVWDVPLNMTRGVP